MRKHITTFGAVALTVALLAPVASAQGRGGRGQGPAWADEDDQRRGCALEQLDLTEEQEEALTILREEHWARVTELRGELESAHEALQALADEDDVTIDDIEAAEDAIDQARRTLHRERRAYRARVFELLTPEQQAALPDGWQLGLDDGFGRRGRGWRHRAGRGGHHRAGWGWGGGACWRNE